jgi:hypothetical protein
LHVGKTVSRFKVEANNAKADFLACDFEHTADDRKLEAGRAAGARIEAEGAVRRKFACANAAHAV